MATASKPITDARASHDAAVSYTFSNRIRFAILVATILFMAVRLFLGDYNMDQLNRRLDALESAPAPHHAVIPSGNGRLVVGGDINFR